MITDISFGSVDPYHIENGNLMSIYASPWVVIDENYEDIISIMNITTNINSKCNRRNSYDDDYETNVVILLIITKIMLST